MPGSALRFPYDLLKQGRRATDQQLWCLGFDVRTEGFPLSQLGWEYHARPDKRRGCARLSGSLPSEGHLSIWGFGFVASDATRGALWMDRKSFRPEWGAGFAPNLKVFQKQELPKFNAPRTPEQLDHVLYLLSELALRLAEHEEDVNASLGLSYREQCLSKWHFKRTSFSPEELPQVWRSIAEEAQTHRSELPSLSTGSTV